MGPRLRGDDSVVVLRQRIQIDVIEIAGTTVMGMGKVPADFASMVMIGPGLPPALAARTSIAMSTSLSMTSDLFARVAFADHTLRGDSGDAIGAA